MNNVYRYVTDRIIAKLQAGVVPWHRPWTCFNAINYVTRKPYRGVNTLLLDGGEYLTWNQIKKLGGTVRRGTQASMIVYYDVKVFTDDATAEEKRIPLLRYYNVFSLADVIGIPSKLENHAHRVLDDAQALTASYAAGPAITHAAQNRAYYSPSEDAIVMPMPGQFHSPEAYYSTLFHEQVHSTGHATRLDRFSMHTPFASEGYSKEELVAEMGAAMLCARCGIDSTIDASASYIAEWLRQLAGDPTLVVKAAACAQRAVDLIAGKLSEAPTAEEAA